MERILEVPHYCPGRAQLDNHFLSQQRAHTPKTEGNDIYSLGILPLCWRGEERGDALIADDGITGVKLGRHPMILD